MIIKDRWYDSTEYINFQKPRKILANYDLRTWSVELLYPHVTFKNPEVDPGNIANGTPSVASVIVHNMADQSKNNRKLVDLIDGLIELFQCSICKGRFINSH